MNPDQSRPTIVVDWGTSNFRAYLVTADGLRLDRVNAADGLNNIDRPFDQVLLHHIGGWLREYGPIPTVMCGMVGSPGGWQFVPHVSAPASLQQLAKNCVLLDAFTACPTWIVPGVSGTGIAGSADVMRGEEVQYFGALQWLHNARRERPHLLCFPGTHNKWVDASTDTLTAFSTTMSGEVFALLHEHSILTHSVDSELTWRDPAFTAGLDYSGRDGGLLHHLFTVRSRNLADEHALEDGPAYLSGLIIGHEIRHLRAAAACSIGIVGATTLAQRYQFALAHFGYDAFLIDNEDATIRGALAIVKNLSS